MSKTNGNGGGKHVGAEMSRFLYPEHPEMHFMRTPLLKLLRSHDLLINNKPEVIKEWLEDDPEARYRLIESTTGVGPGHTKKLFEVLGVPDPLRRFTTGGVGGKAAVKLRDQIEQLHGKVEYLAKVVGDQASLIQQQQTAIRELQEVVTR